MAFPPRAVAVQDLHGLHAWKAGILRSERLPRLLCAVEASPNRALPAQSGRRKRRRLVACLLCALRCVALLHRNEGAPKGAEGNLWSLRPANGVGKESASKTQFPQAPGPRQSCQPRWILASQHRKANTRRGACQRRRCSNWRAMIAVAVTQIIY